MKTLLEVIEEVNDGGRPDYEDLRYSLVALSALSFFDSKALVTLEKAEAKGSKHLFSSARWLREESVKRWQTALNMSPKDYVGVTHDPDNPECQRMRRIAKKLWAKVSTGKPLTVAPEEAKRI